MHTPGTRTGGQAVVEALRQEGVSRAFCVPGESFIGILDALYDTPEIPVVSARHEGSAAFMAEAWGKVTGAPAVCLATRGPGATNLSIGIHLAQQDSTPLVAIVGQVPRGFRHREAWQEVDLVAMFRPLTKWAVECTEPDRLPEMIHRAVRVARSGRPGPVLLAIPQDVLEEPTSAPVLPRAIAPRARPAEADVRAALALLAHAHHPVIVAGGAVLRAEATALLVALAERLEIPVVAGWRRGDVFPNDHRLYLGISGLGPARPTIDRLAASDVLLAIGTRWSEVASQGYTLPTPGTRVIHIGSSHETVGATLEPEVAMVADAGLALHDLLAACNPDPLPPGLRAERHARNAADRAAFEAASTPRLRASGSPVDPEGVMADVLRIVPPETIMVSDVGNFAGWLARFYRFHEPRTFIAPTAGTMGYALPAAIATRLARPDRPVVAMAGDGSFMMTMAELETAVRYGTPVVAIVFDNRMYGTIRMHQELEKPGRPVATELGTPDLVRLAAAFDAVGYEVRDNAEFAPALEDALRADCPALIHLHVDRDRISVDRTMDLS